jgi:propionyl-CoA synthetase
MTNPYQAAFEQSINDPDGFWAKAAEDCHWYKRWDKVLDDSNKPFYRWFTGGEINTCYNALDYHIDQGRGDQLALIYDSPVTDTITKYTYNQLRDEVAKFAGVLKAQGVEKGDRVLIYMPMIAEAAMAMLACARIGAVHSVVFGGFAAKELATRINDAKPKVIVTASCGIEVKKVIAYKPLLDAAIDMSDSKPDNVCHLSAPHGESVHDRRKGRGLGGSRGRRHPGGLCAGGGNGPAIHPLHLGHHGPAQGRGP